MQSELIRDMPFVNRPRHRLQSLGVEALHNEELLALILRTGYPGHGALEVAREALRLHPLPRLLSLSVQQLSALKGIGLSRCASLLAGIELARRSGHLPSSQMLPPLQSAHDMVSLALGYRTKKKEHLIAFFLNARHQLIAQEVISVGTLTASLAHPREIFSPAIGQAAAFIVLVHNHPSGDPSPSEEDGRLTQRIRQAGTILGIELLDHFIIATGGCYSFKQAGLL
jgi:DNA repair protein RadC